MTFTVRPVANISDTKVLFFRGVFEGFRGITWFKTAMLVAPLAKC